MTIPPLSTSALNALNAGFARLDKAAAELTGPADLNPSADSVELSPEALSAAGDPMLAGVSDLMQSKLQVGAAAMLLRTYRSQQFHLLDALNDAGGDDASK